MGMKQGEKIKKIMQLIHCSGQNLILYAMVVILLISGVTVVFHNYNWYDKPIAKIEQVHNSVDQDQKKSSHKSQYIHQIMDGTMMNGQYIGHKVRVVNNYSTSGVLDEQYKKGNEVFIKIDSVNKDKILGSIIGFKRDKYMAVLLAIFILFLFTLAKKKGIFTFLSLAANIGILSYALDLNHKGNNILTISIHMAFFFTCIALIFISGFKKKTFVAILSTFISLGATMFMFKIFMLFAHQVDYSYMDYIAGQNSMSDLFISQLLIGGLGAVMDVAITEASAINELVDLNSDISIKELIQSGREVGHDIMGTMINILLFTYICGIIPLIILKMKNQISLHTIILWQIPMELYGFMIGSIGILLAIPISLGLSIITFKKLRWFLC